MKNKTYNRKKIMVVFVCAMFILFGLIARLVYLMILSGESRGAARKRTRDQSGEGRNYRSEWNSACDK